jgi:outer membrane receptor for monomeric catechols
VAEYTVVLHATYRTICRATITTHARSEKEAMAQVEESLRMGYREGIVFQPTENKEYVAVHAISTTPKDNNIHLIQEVCFQPEFFKK